MAARCSRIPSPTSWRHQRTVVSVWDLVKVFSMAPHLLGFIPPVRRAGLWPWSPMVAGPDGCLPMLLHLHSPTSLPCCKSRFLCSMCLCCWGGFCSLHCAPNRSTVWRCFFFSSPLLMLCHLFHPPTETGGTSRHSDLFMSWPRGGEEHNLESFVCLVHVKELTSYLYLYLYCNEMEQRNSLWWIHSLFFLRSTWQWKCEENLSAPLSVFLSHSKRGKIMEGGGQRKVYIISLRTLLTTPFVFCQIATKTVKADKFKCASVE